MEHFGSPGVPSVSREEVGACARRFVDQRGGLDDILPTAPESQLVADYKMECSIIDELMEFGQVELPHIEFIEKRPRS